MVGPLPGLGVPARLLRGVAHRRAGEQAYRLDVRRRRDLRVQRERRLDARVAGIARREALDLGAHDAEGVPCWPPGAAARTGCRCAEEAALACKDVHRPGHPLPSCQGTEHAVAGVVGRGGRLPVEICRRGCGQGEMRRDGHADGLAHLVAAETEQTRGHRRRGDHLEARRRPSPADAVGGAIRQAQSRS